MENTPPPNKFVEVNGEFVKRLDEHLILAEERGGKTEKIEQRIERWHVGKEIPLAVIATLVIQTVGIVWLAAVTVTRVGDMRENIVVDKAALVIDQKRQDDDSRRSEDRVILRLDKFDAKLDRLIEKR